MDTRVTSANYPNARTRGATSSTEESDRVKIEQMKIAAAEKMQKEQLIEEGTMASTIIKKKTRSSRDIKFEQAVLPGMLLFLAVVIIIGALSATICRNNCEQLDDTVGNCLGDANACAKCSKNFGC